MAEPDPNAPPAPPAAPAPPSPGPPPVQQPPAGQPPERFVPVEELARERERRHQAEARSAELEKAQMTEQQRQQAEVAEGKRLAEEGTRMIREARLITNLAAKGFIGPIARGVTKLLDGVEYDATHEPTNLDDRLEAAKATYSPQMFGGATPPAQPVDPAGAQPAFPNLHQGPQGATPGVDDEADFSRYMQSSFPQWAAPTTP